MTRRKLVEVALPLEAINDAAKADKDRKTGHLRNVHKWFAPMPLGAWRALLAATVLDDPGNEREREALFGLLERLADWDTTTDDRPIQEFRRLVNAASVPMVVDPFCGGGSTVTEALRLGLAAAGSDLNPVPVTITRLLANVGFWSAESDLLAERAGPRVAAGPRDRLEALESLVVELAQDIATRAETELAALYPAGPDGNTVIAWRWARTVASPDPAMRGAHTPLVGSWWLSQKPGREAWLDPRVEGGRVAYVVRHGNGPVPDGTSGRSSRCLLSGTPITLDYIREQGQAGRIGTELIAAVTRAGRQTFYHAPDDDQRAAAARARPTWTPSVPLEHDPRAVSPPAYGMATVADLFTQRQLHALDVLSRHIAELETGSDPGLRAARLILALSLSKMAQSNSTLCLWRTRKGTSKVETAFGRNDIPITWDFAEANPFGGSVGDFLQTVQTTTRALTYVPLSTTATSVHQRDARAAPKAWEGPVIVATDPPYYDQIPYATLSDYFYPFLRRVLSDSEPDVFSTLATPKADELVAAPYRHGGKDAAYQRFTDGLTAFFKAALKAQSLEYPMLVIYAHRQQTRSKTGTASTGWEAMLEALKIGGWSLRATWPIRGTGSSRQRGIGSNALATYVVMVCRPYEADLETGTLRDFLADLRSELPRRLKELQTSRIAPVDFAQAALGAGMEVFGRYRDVLDASGTPLPMGRILELINDALDEALAARDSDFDTATRWAVTFYEQFGWDAAEYGRAESLAVAKNVVMDELASKGLVSSRGGRVRLLPASELHDNQPLDTAWGAALALVRALQDGGEAAAHDVVDRATAPEEGIIELAYRAFSLAVEAGRTDDASAFNSLVVAWPSIIRRDRPAIVSGAEQLQI